MAEGVAALFAKDPAVAAAGLGPAEFSRLFVALIDQESRFDPKALSPKGARGLGQLMPETAAALGVLDAFEPLDNLRGEARHATSRPSSPPSAAPTWLSPPITPGRVASASTPASRRFARPATMSRASAAPPRSPNLP
jgi:hypothetical protein